MPQSSTDRHRGLPWRPIAEMPADASEILAFDPNDFLKVSVAFQREGSGWLRDDPDYRAVEIAPTMFCLIDYPGQ